MKILVTVESLKSKKPEKYRGILEAAVHVFARKGFYHARVSEIAREAGVADGTIYLYFQNKDDILIRLFEEGMNEVIRNVRAEVDKQHNPLEKIRAFARAHLALIERNKDMAEIIQVELRQSSKFMKEYRNEKFYEYLDIISEIVREGQELNVIRQDVLPGVMKRAFFGALDEMSRFWVLSSRKKYNIDTAADQISEFFIKGISA
jgi:TetR/AcrR family transcriptional regulator, fatty acid metabolism regulator protein